jgi:hypothetical protein
MTLQEATKCAQERSRQFRCGTFVCATLQLVTIDGEEKVVVPFNGFCISDWSDGTVVKTFNNGAQTA